MGCCERRLALTLVLAVAACSRDESKPEPKSAPAPAPAPTSDAPRDVVLVTLDTTRADRLGCYGNARGLTPNLDRLASEGTRFAAAVAPMPCTSAAHASLFTGLSPRLHGVTNNLLGARDDLVTLAERLHDAGFATGAFFNVYDFKEANLLQGFDGYRHDKGRRAEHVVPGVAEWLARTPGQRHFAWVHFYVPHGPLDVPAEFGRLVEHQYAGPLRDDFPTMEKLRVGELATPDDFVANYRDRYDAAIAFLDQRIGELRAVLEKAGAFDSTLLFVVGDHGESLEKGTLGLHSPVIRESTLHVPWIVRGPKVPKGKVVTAVVQHVDLVPTVVDALGLPLPSDVEGHALTPLLEAPEGVDVGWDRPAISTLPTSFEGKRSVDAESAAIRRKQWKLVVDQDGSRRLFDLAHDPDEQHDVASDHPDVVRVLRAAFEEWARQTPGQSGPAVSPEMAEQLRKLGYGR